jgi:hypothetical protein
VQLNRRSLLFAVRRPLLLEYSAAVNNTAGAITPNTNSSRLGNFFHIYRYLLHHLINPSWQLNHEWRIRDPHWFVVLIDWKIVADGYESLWH